MLGRSFNDLARSNMKACSNHPYKCLLNPKLFKKHADVTATQHATPKDPEHCCKKAAVLVGQVFVALKLQHLFPQDRCGYASTELD